MGQSASRSARDALGGTSWPWAPVGAVPSDADSPTPALKPGGQGISGGDAAADADTLPPLLTGWACDHHGTGRHSVFGSYRVATEGPPPGNGLIVKLVDALERPPGPGPAPAAAVTAFYDVRCLNAGESWEAGLKNGLEGASLVMPLVSAGALRGMIEHAATRRDNLLMEWEIALARQRAGLCMILPIFISDFDEDGRRRTVDFREASYPAAPHFLSHIPIRETVAAVLKLQGTHIAHIAIQLIILSIYSMGPFVGRSSPNCRGGYQVQYENNHVRTSHLST